MNHHVLNKILSYEVMKIISIYRERRKMREREREQGSTVYILREKVPWNLAGSTLMYENEPFPASESLARLLLFSGASS